jgi:uncharacterized membrane protein YvbJ
MTRERTVISERCGKCGAIVEPSDHFCPECGAEVTRMADLQAAPVMCKTCGSPNRAGAKFCIWCGRSFDFATPQSFGVDQNWRVPEGSRWQWKPQHYVWMGLVVIVGVIYLIWYVDKTVSDIDELIDGTKTPVVRELPTPRDTQSG